MTIISIIKKFTKLSGIICLFLPVIIIYSLSKNVLHRNNLLKGLTYFTGAAVGTEKVSADVPGEPGEPGGGSCCGGCMGCGDSSGPS